MANPHCHMASTWASWEPGPLTKITFIDPYFDDFENILDQASNPRFNPPSQPTLMLSILSSPSSMPLAFSFWVSQRCKIPEMDWDGLVGNIYRKASLFSYDFCVYCSLRLPSKAIHWHHWRFHDLTGESRNSPCPLEKSHALFEFCLMLGWNIHRQSVYIY